MRKANMDPPDQSSNQLSTTEGPQSVPRGAEEPPSQALPECLTHKMVRCKKTVIVSSH